MCAFGVSFQSLEEDEDGGRRSQEKMGCSTYTQKNVRNGHGTFMTQYRVNTI